MFRGSSSSNNLFPEQGDNPLQLDLNGPCPLQQFGYINFIHNTNFLGLNQVQGQTTMPSNPVPVPESNYGLHLGLGNPNRVKIPTSLTLSSKGSETTDFFTLLEATDMNEEARAQVSRYNQEMDKLIKLQEKEVHAGYLELKKHHVANTATLMNALNRKFEEEIRKKDLELETVNEKNRDLLEKLEQTTLVAQHYQMHASNTELMVETLKTQLRDAINLIGKSSEMVADNSIR